MTDQSHDAAGALVEALLALRMAQQAVTAALAHLRDQMPPSALPRAPGERSTAVQVLTVLARNREPMDIGSIAEEVLAIRRDEDAPRKHAKGTRYEEICRNALLRMIKQGLVERVPPTSKDGRMRFQKAPDL